MRPTCARSFSGFKTLIVAASVLSCGSEGDTGNQNEIGSPLGVGTGGNSSSMSTGGQGLGGNSNAIGLGGTSSTGGVATTGGATSSGSAKATGGTGSSAKATGGANGSGGVKATGGTTSGNSAKATGGSTSGGGAKTTGGANSSGGAKTTGGAGGSAKATGGAGGGAKATGGANSSGGGAKATGGALSTGGTATSGGATGTGGPCSTDTCPMATGLKFACKQRFALGVNYAWHDFGADFGGIPDWGMLGVSQTAATYSTELAQMAANGVSVIRWWMFPDFRGAGVEFDASNNPSGISTTAKADIVKALELAEANDLYLVLTIFSFDNFRPDRVDSGLNIRGMAPMVSNATRRAALVNNIVRPVARAAAGSPNAHRLLGWDVINEPEWAISATGNAPGGQDFSPNAELTGVSLSNMKALINESIAALREETPNALTSVGWAAAKWSWAFEDVNVDFHQPHIYGWVNDYWPYTSTPAALGYTGKPTVMGEFFLTQMPFETSDTFSQILNSWWNNGYAGAWSWQFIEQQNNLSLIKTFADAKGCSAGF